MSIELSALDDACVRSLLTPGFTQLELQVQPLRSGMVSASVLHARARYRDGHGKPRSTSFVIKTLEGSHIREAAVYQHLASAGLGGLAPDCLGVWPWRDLDLAQQVLHALARLHAIAPSSRRRFQTDDGSASSRRTRRLRPTGGRDAGG